MTTEDLLAALRGGSRDRVPRLKDNPEADRRFDAIKNFVAAREHPGDLLGQDLLEKMKAQLKADKT